MSELARHIQSLIVAEGPLPLDRYMLECLAHPRFGYYMSAEPFGVDGDFTTAPEISQMFGELVALWLAEQWLALGQPRHTRLVELGPGRGTLMADALRALKALPALRDGLSIHLIETSPRLEAIQKDTLKDHANVHWHSDFNAIPDGPVLLIANELFDALPIRQFIKTDTGFAERHVGFDGNQFQWCDLPTPRPSGIAQSVLGNAKAGDLFETSPMSLALLADIAHRIANSGGAGLIIDYGYKDHAAGDSLQAVKSHNFSNPLAHQGTSDLTAHVNFAALVDVAKAEGAFLHGPVTQGTFLSAIGIHHRAQQLAKTRPEKQAAIQSGLHRLIDPDKMGELFKVMGLTSTPTPASGFGETL